MFCMLCDVWSGVGDLEALGSGDGMKRLFGLYRRELDRLGGIISLDCRCVKSGLECVKAPWL